MISYPACYANFLMHIKVSSPELAVHVLTLSASLRHTSGKIRKIQLLGYEFADCKRVRRGRH